MMRNQALTWLRRNADYFEYADSVQIVGEYLRRKFRVTDYKQWIIEYPSESHHIQTDKTVLEIGDSDFDRWANSVGARIEIDLSKPIYPQIFFAMQEAELPQKDNPND